MLAKTTKGVTQIDVLDLTPENYIVPAGTKHVYHCRIEVPYFDSKTGVRVSVPRVQMFDPKFFESFGLSNLRKQGYVVDILHDPRPYLAELRQANAQAEEAAKMSAAERKAAERAQLRKEVIAELIAAGLIQNPDAQPDKAEAAKTDAAEADAGAMPYPADAESAPAAEAKPKGRPRNNN